MSVTVITASLEDIRQLVQEVVREEVARAGRAKASVPAERDALVSIADAARATGSSPDSIRRLIQQGRIPDRRAGGGRGHYRVRISEVEAAMLAPASAPVDPERVVVSMLERRR